MGGNLLPNSKRLNREDYKRVCDELTRTLSKCFRRVAVPLNVTDKESYGDVDFVVCDQTEKVPPDLIHIKSNGPTVSYNYQDFQVDIHHSPSEEFDSCVAYKQFGDLGNLAGRIAKKFGLVYGMDGLSVRIYYKNGAVSLKADETCLSVRWNLSRDPKEIFEYLGFNYRNEFATEMEVFEYLIGSKYFCTSYFTKTEEYDRAARMRSKKRPMFIRFIKHLNEMKVIESTAVIPSLEETIIHFGLQNKLESFKQTIKQDYEFTQRFNSKMVMALTGLTGVRLGKCMKKLRQIITVDNSHNVDWLEEIIKETARKMDVEE